MCRARLLRLSSDHVSQRPISPMGVVESLCKGSSFASSQASHLKLTHTKKTQVIEIEKRIASRWDNVVSHFILFNNVVFELKFSRSLLFLHYVLIEVLKQSKQTTF